MAEKRPHVGLRVEIKDQGHLADWMKLK